MIPKLIFLSGSKSGQHIELSAVTRVGRQPDLEIVFLAGETLVSTLHATIFEEDGDYWVRDEASRNGTLVNRERIELRRLKSGDVVEFGAGGPRAQFTTDAAVTLHPTFDPAASHATLPPTQRAFAAITGSFRAPLSASREFISVALDRAGKRTRRLVATAGFVGLLIAAAMIYWNIHARNQLSRALTEISAALDRERTSRAGLAVEFAALQTTNDSLQRLFDFERLAVIANTDFGPEVVRSFSRGVALLVYAYAYQERNSSRMLRYRMGPDGRVVTTRTPEGRAVPELTFSGSGPVVEKSGSATAFLIDSAGYLLTNRHVAEAWADDEDLEQLRKSGADVDPVFTILRAYFPPGGEPLALTVVEVSRDQDVALLRTLRRTIDAPVVLLGRRSAGAAPGQEVVLIGYPTGVHNLMFRVDQTTREEIANSVGDGASPVRLAAELARRNFVQPLVTLGTISDTTVAEIIHTAQSTGGGSGGPIISAGGRVMGIHYAFVTSPLEGDPFRTQRAVKISYAWDILPNDLARRLNAATRPTPGTPPSEVRR